MTPDASKITIHDNLEEIEQFINEIIVSPRRSLKAWASITNQTPAAKIGYIGQHLASLITGVPGCNRKSGIHQNRQRGYIKNRNNRTSETVTTVHQKR